jgi:hypothetical protein
MSHTRQNHSHDVTLELIVDTKKMQKRFVFLILTLLVIQTHSNAIVAVDAIRWLFSPGFASLFSRLLFFSVKPLPLFEIRRLEQTPPRLDSLCVLLFVSANFVPFREIETKLERRIRLRILHKEPTNNSTENLSRNKSLQFHSIDHLNSCGGVTGRR